MEYASVPSILIICYLVGEAFKIIVKKNKEKYKFIPIVVSVVGGILGVVFYYTYPEMVLNASNPIVALIIGIASGAASTGSNQIIKQLFGNKEEENTSNSQSKSE